MSAATEAKLKASQLRPGDVLVWREANAPTPLQGNGSTVVRVAQHIFSRNIEVESVGADGREFRGWFVPSAAVGVSRG